MVYVFVWRSAYKDLGVNWVDLLNRKRLDEQLIVKLRTIFYSRSPFILNPYVPKVFRGYNWNG